MRFEKLLLAAAALCLVCMAPACSDDDPATDPEQNETPGTPGEGEGDGDDDSGEPGEPDTPDTPALTEGVRAEGYYKGDYHDEGRATIGSTSPSKTRTIPEATISSASISTVRWRPTPISRRWTSETIR